MIRVERRRRAPLAIALAALLAVACGSGRGVVGSPPGAAGPAAPEPIAVWIGTYTDAGSRGIYRSWFDPGKGELSEPVLAADSPNPSFLALRPDGRVLYAVNELTSFGGVRSGAVSAFAIDPVSGSLSPLGQETSGGADPCHLSLDRAGRHLFVANYTSGSAVAMAVRADGRLGPVTALRQLSGSGPDATRQEGPHAHQIGLDPSERFALVTDLGSDRIDVFRYESARGELEPNHPPAAALTPGSGPRHLAWHPNGRFVYALAELSSTVTVLRWDGERGSLATIQTVSTLPPGFAGTNTAAEIAVSADGRFVYASNRGDDTLALFSVDAASGTLKAAGRVSAGGRTPRQFTIDPTGRWMIVALQGSDTIQVFRLDAANGSPSPWNRPVALSRPVCILLGGAVARP